MFGPLGHASRLWNLALVWGLIFDNCSHHEGVCLRGGCRVSGRSQCF